jgi:alcohol dehydrogenase
MFDLGSMKFSFWLKTDVRYGAGTLDMIPEYLRNAGVQRIGLVVDAGVLKNEYWKALVASLAELTVVATIVCDVAEPDYDYLDVAKQPFAGQDIDMIVAAGGGSALDLAKAVSVLVTNPGPAIGYRGFNLIKQPGIPLIAIPTTAGTGSEVTPNAVFTDKKEMRKLGINTDFYVPRLAVLDPRITLSCPRSVTSSSGVDALVHTLESFVAQRANPVSRMLSREAFKYVFNNLAAAVEQPDNLAARGNMQLGAFYAGTALMNSGAGPAGAMSYPLGVHFRVPHGVAGGVFVARIVRYNVQNGYTRYSELYDLIDGADRNLSDAEKSQRLVDDLDALLARIGIPSSLQAFGVTPADVKLLAEQTFLLKPALDQNPIAFTVADAQQMMESMV